MAKGSIVLVPFPFDDLTTTKVRPALCLTDPVGPHRHVVLAFITSRVAAELPDSDLLLDTGHPDFAGTGLRVASTVRLHRLTTLSASLIRRRLGRLPQALQPALDEKLRSLFGL